jgi:hypothetical protein
VRCAISLMISRCFAWTNGFMAQLTAGRSQPATNRDFQGPSAFVNRGDRRLKSFDWKDQIRNPQASETKLRVDLLAKRGAALNIVSCLILPRLVALIAELDDRLDRRSP